jgi:signal transduction histidine kinase
VIERSLTFDRRALVHGAAIAAGVLAVALARAVSDPRPDAVVRHAYLVPVIAAALRFGTPGGALTALVVLFLEAPRLFVAAEGGGLSQPVMEASVTCLEILALGPALGALTAEGRRQRRRYETLLAVQQALGDEVELDAALERLSAVLAARLDADVAIVARDGTRLIVQGAPVLEPASPAALALRTGTTVFVADVGGGARPRRAQCVPLMSSGASAGALVVERDGELNATTRQAVSEIGVALGLALENARLASRQRRFTEELARRVEEVTAAKSAVVALASHELRTPLTALLGFSELLATRAFSPQEVRRLAGIVSRETERLARLVDDVLDLSRMERGLPLRLAPVPTDVAAAVQSAVDLFRRGRATHRVAAECDAELPRALADPDALDRILKNLISNAIKYSPEGTAVRVRASARDGVVTLVVEDQGRGIAPDALARIFEPYFRAPEAAQTVRGTGLGLAVVKSLVDAHGGAIDVTSALGEGTRFTVQLPAVP